MADPVPGPNLNPEFTLIIYAEGDGLRTSRALNELAIRNLGSMFKALALPQLKAVAMHHDPSGAVESFVGKVNGKDPGTTA